MSKIIERIRQREKKKRERERWEAAAAMQLAHQDEQLMQTGRSVLVLGITVVVCGLGVCMVLAYQWIMS